MVLRQQFNAMLTGYMVWHDCNDFIPENAQEN